MKNTEQFDIKSFSYTAIGVVILSSILLWFGYYIGYKQHVAQYANLKQRCDGAITLVESKTNLDFKCTFK